MKRLFVLLAALAAFSASAQTTLAPGSYSVASCPAPVTPPPVVVGSAPTGTFWLFHNGAFTTGYPGDYSFGSGKFQIFTTGNAHSPPADILLSGDIGFQPMWPYSDLDLTGYKTITVAIKPTVKEFFQIGMLMIGDQPIPGSTGAVNLNNSKYGPNPMVIGQWNVYVVPLSAFGTMPVHVYKFMVLHQNTPTPPGATGDSTEVDDIGVSP